VDTTIASFDPKKVNRYCLGSPDFIIVHKAWGGYPFPVSCACVTEIFSQQLIYANSCKHYPVGLFHTRINFAKVLLRPYRIAA